MTFPSPPPGPAPLPPHMRILAADLKPITTVVNFKGKNYTVTFTPPDPAKTGKGYTYKADTVKTIEEIAQGILAAQEKKNPSSLSTIHTIQALFTEDTSGATKQLEVKTKTATGSFETASYEPSDLTAIASKISTIYHSALIDISSVSSSYMTCPLKKLAEFKSIDDVLFSPISLNDILCELGRLKQTADNDGPQQAEANRRLDELQASHPGPPTISELIQSLIDGNHFRIEDGNITEVIDLDAVVAKFQSPVVGAALSAVLPASLDYSSLKNYIFEHGNPFPGLAKAAVAIAGPVPKGIANPCCNCFLNSAIIGFLSNANVYTKLQAALEPLKASDANPTVTNYAGAAALPADTLDDDFEKWNIGNGNASTKALLNDTFLRMKIKDAAKCASSLLAKWQSGVDLSSKESQLLRLALIKLCAKTSNSTTGHAPHLIRDDANGINYDPTGLSISPTKSEDASELITELVQGINELLGAGNVALQLDLDHAKISIIDRPISLDARSILTMPYFGASHKQSLLKSDLTELKNSFPADDADKPTTVILQIPRPTEADTVVDCSRIDEVFDRESGYAVESITIHHHKPGGGEGHFWTYRKEGANWMRYDDQMDPTAYPVQEQEVDLALNGYLPGSQVQVVTLKKT